MFVLRFIPLLIILLLAFRGNAVLLPHNTVVITGTPTLQTTSINPPAWATVAGQFTDLTRKGVVTFGVDHHYLTYVDQSVTEITVYINKFSSYNASSAYASETKTFRVSYYPMDSLTYVDEHTMTFDNVEKMEISIIDIKVNGVTQSVLPGNLYLQGDVFVDRISDFSPQVNFEVTNLVVGTPVNTDCVADGVNDELTISWDPFPRAEEYQLEWTFVNTVGLTTTEINNLKIDFKNNSTRISTKELSYKIALMFDQGFVVFRVRAVGRSKSSPYNLLFSKWTILDGPKTLSSVSAAYKKNTVPFDLKKNWQYSATYAEEGKKKEVVSFYDGSLRNRQMVTKISTDRNAIVGETIYDHQGRPAIQVLPVPVAHCESEMAENSLRFYRDFNKNESGAAYSKLDFDKSSPGDSCNPINVGTMNTNSGASNYYSTSNPNKEESQAYVPIANGYPFSQVEYTPDNTGRIRRQGGVGQEFQLSAPGETHPTEYFYAHPLQEQLDRLFGSEVGDASHYQKNMVVDPNGQVSISYLDQEGRVIATSLAGESEANGLMPLPSAGEIAPLTVDLFAKDATGNSTANKLSFDGMAKEFSQTLALSSPSTLFISYDMGVEKFTNGCLGSLCLNCVYDLTIEVRNTCGELQSPVAVSSKMIGHFNQTSDGVIFLTDCQDYDFHNEFVTPVLPVGTYQITKKLTINQQALEAYLQMYTDPNPSTGINTCLDDYATILGEVGASSNIDDCEETFSCSECVANLGSLLEYIQAGGTEDAYKEELAACNAPCKGASYYENMREIMMLDVSCEGQYGQYLDNQSAVNASIFPVSIFNTNNKLPDPYSNLNPNWRYPVYDVETVLQYAYFDEDGVTRSRIPLTNVVFSGTPGSTPAVVSGPVLNTNVFLDNATGEYYTYPEKLANVSDFIQYYSINKQWANSLVYYHPEYAYLKKHKEFYTHSNPDFEYSSEEFDMKMQSYNTWVDAKTAGFVKDADSNSVNNRINSYWATSGAFPRDEFLANSTFMAQMMNKINSYTTINGVSYSMMQVAAMMNRSGNALTGGASPLASDLDFGKDLPGYSPTENTLLHNAEWMTFRGMYLAEKQQMQKEAAADYAFNIAYNGCIGNDSFNPFQNGFLNIFPLIFPYFNGQFLNVNQPCSIHRKAYYINKQPRFGDPLQNVDSDPSQVAYQLYVQTGQCPIASSLQRVLNEVVTDNNLTNTGFSATATLNTLSGLMMAMLDFQAPAVVPALTWVQSNTSAGLTATLQGTNSVFATINLVKSPYAYGWIYSWTDIVSFNNLHFTQIGTGGLYEFTIAAKVDSSGILVNRMLSGSTTLKIGNCSFPEVCKLNDFGKRLEFMTQTLVQMGAMFSTNYVDLTTSPYNDILNNTIKFTVNPAYAGAAVKWKYDATLPGFWLSDLTSTVKIKITGANPAVAYSSISFIERLEAGPNNTMKLVCNDASNVYLTTLSCELLRTDNVLIPVGKCGLDDAILCQGLEYDTYDDLIPALKNSLETQDAPFNLYNALLWTDALNSQLVAEPTSIPGTVSDTILTYDLPDSCDLVLTYSGSSSNFSFDNIVSVDDVQLINQNGFGSFNDFKLYITYTFGGNSYQDSIIGTSCFKMKRCTSCTQSSPNVDEGPAGSDQVDGVVDLSYLNNEFHTTIDSNSELYCLDIYEDYVEARSNKIAELLANGCTDIATTFPLLSYDDFVDRNFCCGSGIITAAYFIYNITNISPTDCSATNSSLEEPSCEELTNSISMCGKIYTEYTRYISFFNNSVWAQAKGITLTAVPSGTYDCICYSNYIMYLLEYISANATMNLSNPLMIADYCASKGDETDNSCGAKYDQYVSCTKYYNDHSGTTALPIVDFDVFMENQLCHCLDEYCSALSLTLQNLQDEERDLLEFCREVSEIPCVMDTPTVNFETFEVSFNDPCTEFYQSNNEANAQNQFNEQIQNFYTQLGQEYISHCMKAVEDMSMTYSEIEHHYTLYYYDQAGNLIKTVPPEGVQFIDMSNPIIKNGILEDRLNNTHKVITSHRMATTYLYNSLNQLVAQNMPDQDAMKVFEPTLPNGLPIGLTTTAIQMLDANQGYLSGYMDATGIAPLTNRGYLFKTSNGGQNWVRVTNTLGTDMREVQMANATIGYAMASNGLNLITKDGGSTWDLLDFGGVSATYAEHLALEVVGTDAYLLHSNGRILKVTSSGIVSTYKNGVGTLSGVTITKLKDFSLQNNVANLQGILYLATVYDGTETYDAILVTVNTIGTNLKMDKAVVGNLNALSFYTTSAGLIGGEDGNLSLINGTTTASFRQRLKQSDAKGNIDQIHMLNANVGLARILENGVKVIRKTTDGGATWTALSNEYTNAALSFNRRSATNLEVLVQGYEGAPVSAAYSKNLVISTSGACAELSQNPNVAQNLNMTLVSTYNDGTNLTYYGLAIDPATSQYKLYKSNAFTLPGADVTFTAMATLGASSILPKEMVVMKSGSEIAVEVLLSTGTIWRSQSSGGTFPAFANSSGLTAVVSMDKITFAAEDYVLAYRSSDNKVYLKAATGAAGYLAYATPLSPGASSITKIAVHGASLTLIGSNGGIFTVLNVPITAGSALTFTDRTKHQLYDMNALRYTSTMNLLVGANGQAFTRPILNTETTATLRPLGITSDLKTANRVTYDGSDHYLFGGTNGAIAMIKSIGTLMAPLYTTAGPTLTNHLAGKTINDISTSGSAVYVAGDNGSVYYTPDLNTSFFAAAVNQTSQNFLGISIIPGTQKAIAAGTASEVFRYSGSTGMRINQVFGPKYNDVHFENGQIGTLIGDYYFIRSTLTGGMDWKIIRPTTGPGVNGLKKVWTKSKPNGEHFAVIGGVNYYLRCDNGSVSQAAITGTVNDIQFFKADPLAGYIAYNNNLAKINLSLSGGTYNVLITPPVYTPTNTIRGLHIFENTSVIMVGDGGGINYYPNNGSSGYNLAAVSGVTFRDVYFIDNQVGLAVGDAGVIYSLKSNNSHPVTHIISSNPLDFSATAESFTDPETGVTPALYNITALAFGSTTSAIYGGGFISAANIGSKKAMVRFLKYEKELFTSRFYYDRLGRIVVSQNSRQKGGTGIIDDKYSYTLYDGLGRVYEAGEKYENGPGGTTFTAVFGTNVGGTMVPDVVDDTKLASWLNYTPVFTRKEITKSYYDETNQAIKTELPVLNALNTGAQRKRIVHVTYSYSYSADANVYDHATHYDYDIHGNVKTLYQDNRLIKDISGIGDHRLKRTDYIYDLISGNVHRVDYQTGESDQWHHVYNYDADNRITDVYTSMETPLTGITSTVESLQNEPELSTLWDREVNYQYYEHGPLARTVLGEQEVQGTDNVYTLQGWIKAVNSNTLDVARDPGNDGLTGGANASTARDVYGYSLHYFAGDYAGIDGNNDFMAAQNSSDLTANSFDLYNGNIGRMVTTITHPDTREVLPLGNAYKYDQLNRLMESRSFNNLNAGTNSWGSAEAVRYLNTFAYDANGNIMKQLRQDHNGAVIDSLHYRYKGINQAIGTNAPKRHNRLYSVKDTHDYDSLDIDPGQALNNYVYDAEGRLVKDLQEEIDTIIWRVDGKVKYIFRPATSSKETVSFDYDAMGHRIAKHSYDSDNSYLLKKSTFYILDAQGNTISVYDHVYDHSGQTVTFAQVEKHLFGSSRLGMHNDRVDLLGSQNNSYSMESIMHHVGMKNYELSNHLGNVLSVISDKPIPHQNGTLVDYWQADIRQSTDYSPFGVMLQERHFEKQIPATIDTLYNETVSTVYTSDFSNASWTQPSYDYWIPETNDVSLGIVSDRLRVESTDPNDGAIRDFATQAGHEYRVTFNVTDAGPNAYFEAYRINSGVAETSPFAVQGLTAGSSPMVTYSIVLTPNTTANVTGMRLKFREGGWFTVDSIVIRDSTLTDVHFTDLESATYVAPKMDVWKYDPSISRVYNESNAHYFYPGTGVVWSNTFTGMGSGYTYTMSLSMVLQGTAPSRKAQLYLYNVNSSDQLTGTPVLLGEITTSTTFPYSVTLPTTISGNKYAIGWKIVNGASIKLTSFSLSHTFWPNPLQVLPHNFSAPTVVVPSWDGWTINPKTQLLNRVNIGSSNQLVPGVQRTYTGLTANAVYRFTANVNYLSTGGGGIGGFSAGLDPETSSLVTTVQDSLIITGIVNGVSTHLASLRYNTGSSFLASLTFTAPPGTTSIKAEFLPGNTSLAAGYGYYVDNLRLARMTGTNLYNSNFVAGTIVSQNTDGWSTNWATSYMNVLAGPPNKLRASGQLPAISRNFSVTPNDACAFTYTQSENNSVNLIIEQSPNGTSGWSTLMNITSTNGTHVRNFTPAQAYVRVRMSGSLPFSLAEVTLKSTHVDMTVVEIPGKSGYRYGFNSMEKDDEVKGNGNSYDFGARLYDPRVGRWLSIDPQTSKQPSFSPYKAFLNSPIIFKDPDGEDEYLVIIIKNEKTGAQLRLALPEPISNRLRAGNIRGKGYSTNIYETQNYYDYKTVFTITIGADGKTSEDIKQYTLTNSKRYTKTMFSSIVSGVRTGAIVDPDGWDLEQAGGFYMTGENGQGTKYHSKNADYVGNIDKLLSILSNYKKSPEFKISGTLTKDDPNGLWLMIGQLTKSMTKQGDVVDKTMEIVDEVKGNGGGDDSSSGGDSTEVHVSSTGAVKKPGIYTYKQSNSSIKAGETPNKSNSRLIKSPQ